MEQFVLIISIITIVTLVSWFFFQKYYNITLKVLEVIQQRCTYLENLQKRFERSLESLKRDIGKGLENKMANLSEPDQLGTPGPGAKQKQKGLEDTSELLEKINAMPTRLETIGSEFGEKFNRMGGRLDNIETQQGQITQQLILLKAGIEALIEKNSQDGPKLEEETNQSFFNEEIDSTQEKEKETVEMGEQIEDILKEAIFEPSPHQTLIDDLKKFSTEPMVGTILTELEALKSEELPGRLLRQLLEIYHRYYQSELHPISVALENNLRSKYGTKFKHAIIKFNASSALGFEKIKVGEIFKLDKFEEDKVRNKRFDRESSRDKILFELCPQVMYKEKPILQGKIIVS